MNNILFITSRDIYTKNGEFSLINNRFNALYENYELKFNIFSVFGDIDIKTDNLDKFYYDSVESYKWRGFKSSRKETEYIKKRLEENLNFNKPDIIIISGLNLGFLFPILKRFKTTQHYKLIYDLHGCLEEILEYSHSKGLKKIKQTIIYKLLKQQERKYLNYSDGVFIVSTGMYDYIAKEYNLNQIKCFLVPCGANVPYKSSREMLKIRNEYRQNLNLQPSDIAFVYSGGVSPWQNIDKILDIFEHKIKKIKNSKFIFFTTDIDYVSSLIVQKGYDINDFIIKNVEPNKLLNYLLACDSGIIIRDNNTTNYVAFPNKFGEYISSGLNIIISESLKYPCYICENNSIGYIVNSNFDIDYKDMERQVINRKNDLEKYYQHSLVVYDETLNYKNNIKCFYDFISNF